MARINFTNKQEFTLAYSKGQWVYVPLFFIPPEAVSCNGYNKYSFELIEGEIESIPTLKRDCHEAICKIRSLITATIIPWNMKKSELRDIASHFDIPLYWMTGIICKGREKPREKDELPSKRKFHELSPSQFPKLLRALNKVNIKTAVAVQIYRDLNMLLGKSNGYITFEEVLRLKLSDIPLGEEYGQAISLSRGGERSPQMSCLYLRDPIWNQLVKIIESDRLYVFSTSNYTPMSIQQVDNDLKAAAKVAGIKQPVSTLSFRPVKKTARRKILDKKACALSKEVSIKKWDSICQSLPELLSKRGAKSKHDPRIILNGYLYSVHHKISLRNLPEPFPKYSAIHSQISRWVKKGLFQKILDLLIG